MTNTPASPNAPYKRRLCAVPVKPPGTRGEDEDSHRFYREAQIDTLARTLWGEARGEGGTGMQAVANVIMNRVRHAQERGGYWWGMTPIQVCQKPWQFSCWNAGDPNAPKIRQVGSGDPHFVLALKLAGSALAGALPDITHGATHYHAQSITPSWARGETPLTVIGRHVFYRLP